MLNDFSRVSLTHPMSNLGSLKVSKKLTNCFQPVMAADMRAGSAQVATPRMRAQVCASCNSAHACTSLRKLQLRACVHQSAQVATPRMHAVGRKLCKFWCTKFLVNFY